MADEKRRVYLREWRAKNRDKVNMQSRAYTARNKQKRASSISAWRLANKDKRRAHRAVEWAVKTGKLTRTPCHCGATEVQAHHHDYAKPLDVVWLCSACHGREHASC